MCWFVCLSVGTHCACISCSCVVNQKTSLVNKIVYAALLHDLIASFFYIGNSFGLKLVGAREGSKMF